MKSFSFVFKPLILTYNNPTVLSATIQRLLDLRFAPRDITVIENGSAKDNKQQVHGVCLRAGVTAIDYPINRGWGGAINDYLAKFWNGDANEIIIIMAHDCYFTELDLGMIAQYFKSYQTIFVSPQYPDPIVAHYNILKSFYWRPGHKTGKVIIGSHTALFARPILLKELQYDEEFVVYGGEYEIFLRAFDNGLESYVTDVAVVVNPTTDASSEYSQASYCINSCYYAYKRHGWLGLMLRSAVIIKNIMLYIITGNLEMAKKQSNYLSYCILNPGKGLQSYLLKFPNAFHA